MEATFIFALLAILLLLGIPIGTSLGVAGVATILVFQMGGAIVGPNFVAAIASFPLLAIPFFVLAGIIMERAGLAARIARCFELLVGRKVGGLAVVAVLTCMFWGALSGSGPATTAAVGLILAGPMIRHGYDRNFAAATIANASGLSIVIPPSIAFIIYGNITGTSVSALFLAGILPGILMGVGIIGVVWWISRREHWRGTEHHGTWREVLTAFRQAFWALLSPVIILGGIYSGFFTPTEAAVVAVFYSLFVAVGVYRSLSLSDLFSVLVDAAVTSSVIMFIVAFAGIFSWAVSTMGVADALAALVMKSATHPVVLVLLTNVILLVLGMFLDAISISYLVLPMFIPVMQRLGIDPLWYGVVFITALAIGQTTPPVGVNLFTAANLIESDVDGVARRVWPLVAVNVATLTVLSLVPAISTWLPVRVGLYGH